MFADCRNLEGFAVLFTSAEAQALVRFLPNIAYYAILPKSPSFEVVALGAFQLAERTNLLVVLLIHTMFMHNHCGWENRRGIMVLDNSQNVMSSD